MDLAHALKVALDTGHVELGVQQAVQSARAHKARLLIVSTTCPERKLAGSRQFESVPVYHFEGTAVDLGAACGRPFPVSALAVLDPGSSAILSLETD